MWQRIAHLPEAAVHAAEMTSEARLRASSAPPGAIEVISSGAAARNHELPEAREDVGRTLGAPQPPPERVHACGFARGPLLLPPICLHWDSTRTDT